MQLRDYQTDAVNAAYSAWGRGVKNFAIVMPTGSGKTATFSKIAQLEKNPSIAIAHRQELVAQISMAYSRWGVYHQLIAPKNVMNNICDQHMREFGQVYIDPSAPRMIGGVDTLRRHEPWMDRIKLWIMDECHHILQDNKWGKVVARMPNARGLGVTATLTRADKKGLGSHADGVLDDFYVGPSMRDLIERGSLCDYRIIVPPSDLDLDGVKVSAATGDYTQQSVDIAVNRSSIIGDAVEHYKLYAAGKRAVVFTPSVDSATKSAAKFNAAGIPAEVISGTTPDRIRQETVRRFARGELLVLCNVDILGEGYDCPAIECVIMLRPTQSYGLYVQQFGRALRPMDGKTHGIIIDHVGNVLNPAFGLPDTPREWSLDRGAKKNKRNEDEIPLRVCDGCLRVYQRVRSKCPYCKQNHVPQERGSIEEVEGNLIELDAEVLAEMRRAVAKIDGPPQCNPSDHSMVANAIRKNHRERKEAQAVLRESLGWWLAYQRQNGLSVEETYRLFYYRFHTDVMTAHTLGKRECYELADKIALAIGAEHRKYAV